MGKEGKKGRSKCSTSSSLEVIGDRWSLLLIRDFIFAGHREFSDFLKSPERISTNILASRLDWLVENHIFTKHHHPKNKKKYFYEITNKGFDLIIVVMALADWGWRHIPKAWSPPDIKKAYKANPENFINFWKIEVQKRSKKYISDMGTEK